MQPVTPEAPEETTAAPEAEGAATETAAAETPAVETPEPVDYTALAAPEGVEVSDESLKAVREFAEAEGLSLDTAQKLISRDAESYASFVEQGNAAMQEEGERWIAEIKSDPELGGANFARTELRLETLLTQYGPPGFYDRLKANRFLYAPDFARTLNTLAAMTEEATVPKGEPVPPEITPRDIFPNSKSMFEPRT